MTFRSNSNNRGSAPAAAQSNERATSVVGFLNIYVPTKSGDRKKLGALYLDSKSAVEAAVNAKLEEGGEEALKELVSKLIFSYSPNNGTSADDLDI